MSLEQPSPPPGGEQSLAPKRRGSFVSDVLEVLVFALIMWFLISNAVQTVRVQGHSMDDSLHNDDLLLASKLSYRLGSPQVGDIIILRDPGNPQIDFIKRVVATPGTEVWVDKAHVCLRNPATRQVLTLVEPYVKLPWTNGVDATPHLLAADQYFVMGDNRSNSTDSRVFGPLARSAIVGQAWIRLWPADRSGLLGTRPAALAPPPGVCAGVP